MSELISKLFKFLPKAKDTSLLSYLAHLYNQTKLLSSEETRKWAAQDKIWSYGDTESEARSGESDSDLLEPSLAQPSLAQLTPTRTGVKRKNTPRTLEGERRVVRARMAEQEVAG